MIYATRGNITLQVSIQQGKISITPVVDQESESRLLAVIARNEELLAQMELKGASAANYDQQLFEYFSRKGWTVEQRNISQTIVVGGLDKASTVGK